jgi:epoxide hydrolase 4
MSLEANHFDPSIRFDYTQIGDVRLHYAEKGAGKENLVLLLHGFPECWYSWRHQLSALGSDFHVVAPDLRGYNLSSKPASVADYRMERLVDDILGLIRHFGQDKAYIVGHDWGAAIAWETARRFPESVLKMVALQVPPMAAWRANMTLKQALLSWYMLFFQLPRVPEWFISMDDFASLKRTFRRTTYRPNIFTDRDLEIYKSALREPGALTAAINYYRANLRKLFSPDGADKETGKNIISAPAMFIYGEHDFAIAPETVRDLGRWVEAEYREVRIPRSGHWVQQEAKEEVTGALRNFLAP